MWVDLIRDVAADVNNGDAQVLQSPSSKSMKASFETLDSLVAKCQGVLSLEHKFVGAFTSVPVNRVYDISEIPPFGELGDSEYDGLRPDRIDCVLVSKTLATSLGGGFNMRIRYENYIKPYVQQLQAAGAETYEVPTFGQVYVLPKSQ